MTFDEATKQVRDLGWQGVAVWYVNNEMETGTWDGALLPKTELGQDITIQVYADNSLSYRRGSAQEALEALVELAGKLHDEAVQRGG